MHNQKSKIEKTKRNPTIDYNKPIKPNGFCNNLHCFQHIPRRQIQQDNTSKQHAKNKKPNLTRTQLIKFNQKPNLTHTQLYSNSKIKI